MDLEEDNSGENDQNENSASAALEGVPVEDSAPIAVLSRENNSTERLAAVHDDEEHLNNSGENIENVPQNADSDDDMEGELLGFADPPDEPLNIVIESNDEDASSASDDLTNRFGPRYDVYVHTDRVHAAIRGLISESRRADNNGGHAYSERDSFMQRLRRAIFSLDRNRQHNVGISEAPVANIADENEAVQMYPEADEVETEERVEEEMPENPIRFDTNLPAEHSYLGTNMNRVSGVNYLDVGHQNKMLLFMHQHILFPGEVLPFMISNSIIENDMDTTNGLLFGLVFLNINETEQEENLYGVTCQIYEKGGDERGNVLVKSRALQRFVTKKSELSGPLQYIATHPEHKCYGYVEILPEIYLPEPLKCINMGSMNRFRDNDSMRGIFKLYQVATTPLPAHAFNYYNISDIVQKARKRLAEHKIDTMPTDPVQMSFWLVRNLHFSENMMRTIFITDSVNTRMRLISDTLNEDSIYICRYCGNRIAKCSDLFAMSKHGVQSQYCNSTGYIHETNTVYHLLRDAVSYSGSPSTEFSWFPGYQWHIVVCKICSRHIGWEFKALEPNLVPKSFFGISSYSVRINVATTGPTNPRAVIYRNILRLARRDMQ